MTNNGKTPEKKRYLSRNVIVDGVKLGLSVVTIDSENNVTVLPFEKEIAGTLWTDSTIVIDNLTTSTLIRFIAQN